MLTSDSTTASPELAPFIRMFEESEEQGREERERAERDRDYYDGFQWTHDEAATLEDRGQPVVAFNLIQRKVDFLSGLEKQSRKDPKAFPRNPGDEGAARAATDALRYVCDDSMWDEVRSEAWENIIVEGTGAVMVGAAKGRQGIDPTLVHIPWDRLFWDPHSRRADFSDAAYLGIVTWYDVADAKGLWGESEAIIDAAWNSGKDSRTFDDKPTDKLWADYNRKRVRVVEVFYKAGSAWMTCTMTRAGFLSPPAPSPYLDEEGQPENPIKAISLRVDRKNKRYGDVRVMIDPQDELNKRHSKALHLITMSQTRVSPASGMDAEQVRRERAKPDGIFTGEKEDFDFVPTNDMAVGNLNLMQHATDFINGLGANAALQGKNEADMSGRAILAQQQGGMVEIARSMDRLRSLSLAVYRAVWNRVRQYWDAERWIRVTDDDRNLRFVGLNQPITLEMLAQEVMEGDQEAMAKAARLVGQDVLQAALQGDQQAMAYLGEFVRQFGKQVVEIRNAVNEIDIDITIDEGMDTPTVQAEQFDTLVKMVPNMFPQGMPPPVLEMLIEASSLRDKDKLLQILDDLSAPAQPDPMEEQVKQLQLAGAAAEVDKTVSEAEKNRAQAATAGTTDPMEPIFRAAEIETDQFNAVTDRMQAMQPAEPAGA